MKRTIRIDASSLVKSSCILRWKRIVADGYTDKLPYNDTQYGSAFHKFVSAIFELNGDFGAAFMLACEVFNRPCEIRKNKGHLNLAHLQKTCVDYWRHYLAGDNFETLVVDGKPLVEKSFDLKFIETEDYIFNLTGTIDKLGKIKNGCYCFGDYKTHSLWSVQSVGKGSSSVDKEVQAFFSKFEMSLQLRFYAFCLKLMVKQNPDSELGKIFSGTVGAFIDGVFLSRTDTTKFVRSEVFTNFCSEKSLKEIDLLLKDKIADLLLVLRAEAEFGKGHLVRDGIIHGACVEHQYPCSFWSVCSQEEEEIKEMILKNNFTRKEYNPLNFGR